MELIERYVYAVVSKLPEKQREDIAKEIRTLIDDMLEGYQGEIDETRKVEKVLLELGDPKVFAEKYMDQNRYLIGPKYFNKYLFILKIVLGAVAIAMTIASTVEVIFVEQESFSIFLSESISELVSALFQAFTWVTVIFAIIEYKKVELKQPEEDQWDINKLEVVPHKKAMISKVESIIGIVFITVFSALLYFSPEIFAAYLNGEESGQKVIHIFNLAKWNQYKFLIIGMFIIGISKEIVKLIYGRWSIKLAIAYSILSVISLFIMIAFFVNPSIWNQDFVNEISNYYDIENVTFATKKVINSVVKVFVLISLIEIATVIFKGIKYNQPNYKNY